MCKRFFKTKIEKEVKYVLPKIYGTGCLMGFISTCKNGQLENKMAYVQLTGVTDRSEIVKK